MIDYKTILSTTDQKVTLMQWIQTLAEEFGNAKITDMLFENAGNKSLTFTFKLEDGTTKTASIALYSLSADEKTMIDELYKSVTTSSDGVTFTQAVSFQGNESHNGSEIHNGYSSFLGDENHAGSEMHKGEATFTQLKADDITATDGQELMSWDGTTTALKGKADRPTYNGGELALKSDVNAVSDYVLFCQTETTLQRFSRNAYVLRGFSYAMFEGKTIYAVGGEISTQTNWMFTGVECAKVVVDSIGSSTTLQSAFKNYAGSRVHSVEVFNTSKVTSIGAMFAENDAISVIPAFDFSSVTEAGHAFYMCKGITSFLATGLKVSFNLSYSTRMTAEALRVVIDNLADVSELGTSPTLTLGSTNLAKLNADDITTANNKGWNLA